VNRRPSFRPIVAIGLLSGALGGCAPALLDPAGPIAAGERTILFNAVAIMLVIVVPTIFATIVFAWWFRAGNDRAEYRPRWSYSGKLELLVWSVPLLVIIFLGGMGWIASHQLDPKRPITATAKPMTVQVVAMDWKWLFIYPEQGVATINHLVLPVGTPVTFHVTSATVMNSFFVPQLGSQVYAMAGMDATLHLMADRPGQFCGLSAHYSGAGFADMNFAVDAVSPAQFATWTAATRGRGPALDAATYLRLAGATATMAPVTFGAVQPGLFAAAVHEGGAPVHITAPDGREQ
jgi:cytochrome o ubiquinol oxidase subunit II